ncbi:MAG: tyrosine-protein phosphatase [Rhodospirillales bacterium]|nr:tyrosine-protein phosphatase [Rhodospirillales bacterium]MDE2576949.1 tyrosine-protein phosphatase [Rhodospirillales bacterium]
MFRGSLASRQGRLLAWADSLLVDHAALRLVWTNWGVVAAGRLYRSNHPTPGRLARAVRRHGVRSVINLRGATGSGSDALSRAAAARLGLRFFDVPMSSGRAPPRDALLALIAALRAAPQPALVHCKSGADRAGFAAAVFVLLEGGSTAAALRQLSWRHGHMRHARAGILDALLLRYGAEAEGRLGFADWVAREYDAEALQRGFAAGGLASFLADRVLRRE